MGERRGAPARAGPGDHVEVLAGERHLGEVLGVLDALEELPEDEELRETAYASSVYIAERTPVSDTELTLSTPRM